MPRWRHLTVHRYPYSARNHPLKPALRMYLTTYAQVVGGVLWGRSRYSGVGA